EARDLLGNETDLTRRFTVDITPPTVQITSGPADSSTVGNEVTFSLGGSDNLTPRSQLRFTWALDGNNVTGGFHTDSTAHFTNFSEGQHSSAPDAQDLAGNISSPDVQRPSTVHALPPVIAVDSLPRAYTRLTPARFTLSATSGSYPASAIL